jgi:hypothetical protein
VNTTQEVAAVSLDLTQGMTLAAATLTGLLAGSSLDQSIKDLPARHALGAVAYSAFSRNADLRPRGGVALYAITGVGGAVLTLAAAVTAAVTGAPSGQAGALYVAALLSIAHSFVTTRAAPTLWRQRAIAEDAGALTRLFATFERWQTLRVTLQVATFLALVVALGLR